MTEATIGSNSNELSLDVTVQKLTFSAQTDSSVSSAIEESTGLNALLNETGKIYLSVDGRGTFDSTGSVRVDKKPGATVRKAYLVADGTNATSSVIGTTAGINGTSINWDRTESTTVSSSFSFHSYLSDVTSLVKPTIDAAADGIISIAVDEGNESASYEGLALAVLFDDPSQPADSSVILYFGGLRPTGATSTINFSSPVDTSLTLGATLGLGIGFSNAPAGQTSQVKVNGQPLTQVAGNYDDGQLGNGALFTVGGIGDSPDNPPSDSTDPATDDELYNLLPFINNGDTSLTLETVNPSNDDHIFFAHLTLNGISAVNIPSTITFSTTNYSVQEDGTPITQVTLTRSGGIIGEVSVTLTPSDGTATAGSDYDNNPITVTFGDGETTKTVAIAVIDDTIYEGDKTVNLTLSDPTGGAILGNQINSTLTIVENEPVPQSVYTFTYTYGNGDSYSGYGYAAQGTYTVDQVLDGYTNETGNPGYYTIDSVDNAGTGNNNYVYVTSYTDGDTGYGTTNSISSWGYNGLGSEYGSAYNANYSGDTGFNSYYEADLPAVLQVRLNLLADNNGIAGEIISNDQVGLNRSFFVEIQVGDLRGNAAGVNGLGLNLAWDGLILESIDTPFDPTNIITANFPLLQDGTVDNSSGLINNLSGGSLPAFELGQAIGVNQLERFALLRFQTENSTGTYYFTTTVDNAALADDNPYYSLDVETSQPIFIGSVYNQYNFTYNYGNGDSYTGYVYAVEGTYTAGQTIGDIYNETGNYGYYTIDSIASTTLDSSYNNHVYVTSYNDVDTGFGAAGYLNSGTGYSGLGSEYGYAYDANVNSADSYFSQYSEADILGNQKYNFTYSYGNGDSYSGYGYAAVGTYTAGQTIGGIANETNLYPGGTGAVENNTLGYNWVGDSVYHLSYTFTNVSDALTLNFIGSGLQEITDESWGLDNVKVTAGGFNYSNDFESDSVTGWSSSTRSTTPVGSRNFLGEFGNDTVSLALNDVALNGSVTVEFDLFIINSWDGNGTFSAGPDKFTVNTSDGQTLLNTTFAKFPGQLQSYPGAGQSGQYTIDSVELGNTNAGYNNLVYVTSYTDGDTGYGTTTNVSHDWQGVNGYGGLGSESGYAYDANGYSSDPYFSNSAEADIQNQLFNYTYTYGNGDSYSGYGYALAGTYTAGQVLSGYANETGNTGYYTIDSVSAGTTDSFYNNRVYVTSYTDGDTGYGTTINVSHDWYYGWNGDSGLGSEAGYVSDTNGNSSDSYFSNSAEADILGNQKYNFTYNYGNGDSYSGYGYAAVGTYTAGQVLGGYANETGYTGQYTIDSVELGNTNAGYNGYVYVTSYTDGDTGFGAAGYLNIGTGYSGLGSEYGYAYDANGYSSDSYFSQYYEADIQNQLFNYTYTYGNGDSYSGYGYAAAGTYTAGQVLDGYANETGNTGYYTIDSVSAGTTDSSYNNRVYVTSYTDGDTLYGETTNLYSYGGGSGLGSEYGYAYTADGYTYDSYFSQYSEADLVIPGLAITDNSGNANDSSIKFTTELSKFRKNFQDSDYVRPNYADTTKYFDITNTGSGVLVVSDIQINVSGVTVNLDLSGDKDLFLNAGSSQRVNLTYDPLVAKENFNVANGLVLFTNVPNWSQYEVALSGKSTFNSDINYDGKVNTGDLGSLNQARTNFNKGIFDATTDINGDGLINTLDASALTADIKLKLSV
ncbi:MAG: dockerin type I domain-containing protein [Nostocales cyanobacterium LacPavin_0920_SED1_MAG_38_18]|nr:dockerin type I domain-containing protein [Nostocales cyanobacterium LacPavin_0920_SED1_MAG_38_18]